MIPSWLVRHLENTGQLDTDGLRRTAHRAHCPRCATPLLVGLDADLLGLTARIDPWPINAESEFLAILTGRSTYNLVFTYTQGGKRCWNIDRRLPEHISGNKEWVVVAEHRCGAPFPTHTMPAPRNLVSRMETDDPPF